MKRVRFLLVLVVCIGVIAGVFFWYRTHTSKILTEEDVPAQAYAQEAQTTHTVELEIIEGATFGKLLEDVQVGGSVAQAIFDASQDVYDLSRIRIGRTLNLVFDNATGDLEQLVYPISSEEELYVIVASATLPHAMATSTGNRAAVSWIAERRPIIYDVRVKTLSGTISSSLYAAALAQGIDERAIIALADVFQWSVDFSMDAREGDRFVFTYEERYRDGNYVMPGNVIAGKFVNAGTPYYAFYYAPDDDHEGYYDEEGNSMQKMFLKAPVAFKYISSGFTTGARYVDTFQEYTSSHRAIDYAATHGTPVRTVGDGTVIAAGWRGPYGNAVSIRHNGTYTTNYAHLSGYAVKRGQKVSQGQTIGYVGSTGYSTGPHLHFEMVKNNVKINPLLEVLPPGDPLPDAYTEAYFVHIQELQSLLDAS